MIKGIVVFFKKEFFLHKFDEKKYQKNIFKRDLIIKTTAYECLPVFYLLTVV